MVGDPMPPLAAQFAVLAARDQRSVLARDRRLIDEAVERPGLHLALVELAVVQKTVERMQIMVAHGSDGAQRRLERIGSHGLRGHVYVHGETSIPSNAISQPAAFTFASSVDPSMRIGFELLMWMRMRRTCAPPAFLLFPTRACGPCASRFCRQGHWRSFRRRRTTCRRKTTRPRW